MTILELRKNNYSAFSALDNFNKLNSINAINYAEQIGALANMPVKDWPLGTLLRAGEGPALIYDKNKINQILFAYSESHKRQASTLTDEQLQHIATLRDALPSLGLAQIQRDINAVTGSIREYERHIESYTAQLLLHHRRREALASGGSVNLQTHVDKLLAAGEWKFVGVNTYSKTLTLELLNNIYLSYKNDLMGVDIDGLDFGRFTVTLNLATGGHRIEQAGENISLYSSPHPHVNGQSLCLGSEREAMREAFLTQDFSRCFNIIKSCLECYNADSPYVGLTQFAALALRGEVVRDCTWNIASDSQYAAMAVKIADKQREHEEENEEERD